MKNCIVRMIVACLCALLYFPSVACAMDTPWLHTSGKYIKDPLNNTVVLRGVNIDDPLDVYLDGNQPVTDQAEKAVWMAKKSTSSVEGYYARVIRVCVNPVKFNKTAYYSDYDSVNEDVAQDNYFNNYLDPFVRYCIARGVYVIIDWHRVGNYGYIGPALKDFWAYIAPKYKNVPNVLYELYNEPILFSGELGVGNPDWAPWKDFIQPVVNQVRTAAPKNLILVGSPKWDTTLEGAIRSPIAGSNIVYVCHNYPKNPKPNSGGAYESIWDTAFGTVSDIYPVFMTEWGYTNKEPLSNDAYTGTTPGFGIPLKSYLARGSREHISWTVWMFGSQYAPSMFFSTVNSAGEPYWVLQGNPDNNEPPYNEYNNYHGQFAKDYLNALKFADQPVAPTHFYQDFESYATGVFPAGWTGSGLISDGTAGTWRVLTGDSKELNQTSSASGLNALIYNSSSAAVGNCRVEGVVRNNTSGGSVALLGRLSTDFDNWYQIALRVSGTMRQWVLGKKVGGVYTELAVGDYPWETNQRYHLRLNLNGDMITAAISTDAVTYTPLGNGVRDGSLTTGRAGFKTSGTTGRFDVLKVTRYD